MIQFFSNSEREGILREVPNLKDAIKIIKLCYPHNMISKINPSICKAHNVQEVDLSNNNIITFEPIFELRKLRILNLSYNKIANIPKDILKLKRLEKLDLSFNLLVTLASINPLLQLFKIRKANIVMCLEGNAVLKEHQQLYKDKINAIEQQIKIANQKKSKQIVPFKSLNLDKENYQSCQLLSMNKTQQFQLQSAKPSINSLKQAKNKLKQSLNKLVSHDSKLKVITSMKFEGWGEQLFGGFQKQASIVKDYIEVYVKIAEFLTVQIVNPLDVIPKLETSFIQGTQLKQLIKDQHSKFLLRLSQTDVPMKLYKIWVQLFREVRTIVDQIKWESWSIIKCEIRSQQIETLKLISPTKQLGGEDHELQNLLFSSKKLLNCQQNNFMDGQCSECFIKTQQNRRLKEIVDMLTSQNSDLKQKHENLQKLNESLLQNDSILGYQLKNRQQKIIKDLNQKIDASAYQNILLQQAKGIQDLIKCGKHQFYKVKINEKSKANLSTYQTVIPKNNMQKNSLQLVSEFTTNNQKNSAQAFVAKRPYFNKNEETAQSHQRGIKQVRINGKYALASTEKKKGLQREKLKSSLIKLSIPLQKYPTSKNKNSSQIQSSKRLPTKISNEDISANGKQLQIQNVMTSDFLLTETGLQEQNLTKTNNSRKVLAEIIQTESNRNNAKGFRSNSINQMLNCKNTKRQKNKKTTIQKDNYGTYIPLQYKTINLKNQEPYQNYMKYHLRNSIIETLTKKRKQNLIKEQQKQISRASKIKNSIQRNKCDLFVKMNTDRNLEQNGTKERGSKLKKNIFISKSYSHTNRYGNLRY